MAISIDNAKQGKHMKLDNSKTLSKVYMNSEEFINGKSPGTCREGYASIKLSLTSPDLEENLIISVCKKTRVALRKRQDQGLRCPKKRSVPVVHEHFLVKCNAEIGVFLELQIIKSVK
jgi:hypothetical protein